MRFRSSRAAAVALVTLATFTDLVGYSICVPVLPDFAKRLGASATMIGLLFASFGLTLLAVSVPMGAVSDRIGRRAPLVSGMVALAGATTLFAAADSLRCRRRDVGRWPGPHRRSVRPGGARPRHGLRDVGHELRADDRSLDWRLV